MPTPTPTLTTLPPEILLQIADHFLENYLLWKTQLKYLRKATFHLDIYAYINLARMSGTYLLRGGLLED